MSDGYGDQMGGSKGGKFLQQDLKRELIQLHTQPLEVQKQMLEDLLLRWMGDYKQVDDILLMGLSFG
jgi:serine phosphatase RsbU (regulator of sigma subunit)